MKNYPIIPDHLRPFRVATLLDVAPAVNAGGILSRCGTWINLDPEDYERLKKSANEITDGTGRGGCSDCGGKINAAQVKASPAAMEAFLRGEE